MPNIQLPPADKPIGYVTVNGQRLAVMADPAWIQKLEELARAVNALQP